MDKNAAKPAPRRRGLLGEYLYFLRTYKMWWLLPVFLLIFVVGVFVVMAGSEAALMIYALF